MFLFQGQECACGSGVLLAGVIRNRVGQTGRVHLTGKRLSQSYQVFGFRLGGNGVVPSDFRGVPLGLGGGQIVFQTLANHHQFANPGVDLGQVQSRSGQRFLIIGSLVQAGLRHVEIIEYG